MGLHSDGESQVWTGDAMNGRLDSSDRVQLVGMWRDARSRLATECGRRGPLTRKAATLRGRMGALVQVMEWFGITLDETDLSGPVTP